MLGIQFHLKFNWEKVEDQIKVKYLSFRKGIE